MTKSFAIAIPLVAAMAAFADEAALPEWAAINPQGHPVRVAVSAPEGEPFAHLSWTKAIRTPEGSFVLAYSAGRGHNIGGSGPAVSRSTDGGRSFSPPQILMRFPDDDPRYADCGNVALGVAGDGALVLLAMAYRDDEANHIFGWRSGDDGVTWQRTDTTSLGPDKTGSVFGYMLPIEGEGLAVFGHYRAGSTPYAEGIWMAVSQDEGRSWDEARRIAEVPAVEPAVVAAGGRLVGFFRGETRTLRGRQFVGVSDDGGATWTTELSGLDAEEPGEARLAAPFAVENPSRPGELLVLTTERAVPGNTPGRIWLWRGDARTLEFERERVILEFPRVEGDPNTDLGYPWLLHLGGDRWQMFYYHGNSRGACHLWTTELVW
jgi:hypothetical protein